MILILAKFKKSWDNIIIQNGTLYKKTYYIPKSLVENFDGDTVYSKVTKEAKQYKRD